MEGSSESPNLRAPDSQRLSATNQEQIPVVKEINAVHLDEGGMYSRKQDAEPKQTARVGNYFVRQPLGCVECVSVAYD